MDTIIQIIGHNHPNNSPLSDGRPSTIGDKGVAEELGVPITQVGHDGNVQTYYPESGIMGMGGATQSYLSIEAVPNWPSFT